MMEGETISKMFISFTDITKSAIDLGKTYQQVEMVRKILLPLTLEQEKKLTAIKEANDFSSLTLENPIRNYEVDLQGKKKDDLKNKFIAFKAVDDSEDS